MALAISTGIENCQSSRKITSRVRAPNTLRMPISLVRRPAVKAASPNRPRQAMKMAMATKMPKIAPWRSSSEELLVEVVAQQVRWMAMVGAKRRQSRSI